MSKRGTLLAVLAAGAVAAMCSDGGGDTVIVSEEEALTAQTEPERPASPAFAAGDQACQTGLPPHGQNRRHSVDKDGRDKAPTPIPATFDRLYRAAAKEYGMPWQLLAAVGEVETHHGTLKSTSSRGARGPMQFMPDTWEAYRVDGDGDGRKDITNPADAIPAAASYLRDKGAPGDVRGALFAYNRADWYVNDVLYYASAINAKTCTENTTVAASTGATGDPRKVHQNGRLPASALKAPKVAPDHRMWPAAADAFDRLAVAYEKAHGSPICVTSTYRDYDSQVRVRAQKPGLAARPGTSNHGWGLAADLGCGINRFGTPQHEWMRQNAARHGWHHPAWAQQGGSKPEAWHWEFSTR